MQARRQVRRLADDVALLRLAAADQFADHDQPGGDADAHLMAALADLERADRLDHRQRGAHGVFGVGLVRLGIAEIDQHAVAHVFGDEAVEARDHAGRAFVVGGDDVAQVFRIERVDSAVEPTRSQNITVSWRRSALEPARGAGAARAAAMRQPWLRARRFWRRIARRSGNRPR